jgi:TolB-like protein/class 3 adenylate cyclase
MPLAREQRKLAAIIAADVVGYSRLMGRDESGTLARLRKNRSEHLDPVVTKYGGRLVKLTGDGALIEFASAVDALSAAIEFQQAMAEANGDAPADTALVFRMGLHLGDLIVDGDDLYGDGVNIAARLEAEAPAGGILISRNVRDAVAGRVKVTFEDLGGLLLKNIERPVRAFSVHWAASDWQLPATAEVTVAPVTEPQVHLPLPDKPSIAVLPFQNMSGDPEQEYFADGIAEDITTALSRFRSLFVIARNSSFTYKGKSPDIRDVGRALGVRYVLEGSVRKAANRVRITGQLVDSVSGAHLWADRFDGTLDDIFDLQDQVTTTVVAAITPRMEQAEIERTKSKPTERLDAYDYYLRGTAKLSSPPAGTGEAASASQEARALFRKATELDPDFALAYGMAAQCYIIESQIAGLTADRAATVAETARLARLAAMLGKDDAVVLSRAGQALAYVVGEIDEGAALVDRAIALNPNLAQAWNFGGWTKIFLGEPELAIERFARAMRLNPLDPLLFLMQMGTACGHLFLGRYDEASTWAEKALRERPRIIIALRIAAACFALSGRLDEAQKTAARVRELSPGFRISHVQTLFPLRRPQDLAIYGEGLRLAGLE